MHDPVFASGLVTVYQDDFLSLAGQLVTGSVDAVVTDPPFAFAGGISNGRTSLADSQFFEHWLTDVFRALYRISAEHAPWFLWSDWRTLGPYSNALLRAAPERYAAREITQVLIHDRGSIGMGSPFRNQADWIAVVRGPKTDFGDRIPKDQANVLRSAWYYGKHQHHPAEKSVRVAEMLCRWSAPTGGLILDPFMGSGTVPLAARNTGRRVCGVELLPEHVEIAIKRLAQEVMPLEEEHGADVAH